MEANLAEVDHENFLKRAVFAEGQSLDQFLPEDSWQKLVGLFAEMVTEDQLKTYKPWFIVNGLVSQVVLSQLSLAGTIDVELFQYAEEKSMSVGFLEDVDLQFSIIEAVTPSNVLDKLLRSSEDLIEDTKVELVQLYDCYLVSDVSCLTKKMGTTEMGGSWEAWQADLLLKQRNITWVPKIEKSLESGQTFLAVGAGHLIGQGNVLELLEAEGYEIQRVEF